MVLTSVPNLNLSFNKSDTKIAAELNFSGNLVFVTIIIIIFFLFAPFRKYTNSYCECSFRLSDNSEDRT